MSETNGTTNGTVNRIAGASKAPKGSGMEFYAKLKTITLKKKSVTLTADADDAKVNLTVKTLPTLSKSGVIGAAKTGGVDSTVKPKSGIDGFDATVKVSAEGANAEAVAEAFFGIKPQEKE